MIGALILQIILISLNAVFASAEIAVLSMSDTKLKKLKQEGNSRAKKLFSLTQQPARFLATIQVAITLAGLLGGAFAADNFAGPLVELLLKLGIPIPESVVHSVVLVLITLILTYFSLVLGELVPKRIAMKKTESLALGMSGMLYLVSKIFAPLVGLLTLSTNLVLRIIGINPNENDEVVTEEEIRMMIIEGNEQGTIQVEESQMIENIFEFDDTSIEDISTRRRDVVSLYLEDDDETWDKIIHESRFTYYPVCDENQDDIIGVLNTKDYFRSSDKSRKYIMENAIDKPIFVPEGMRANVLFSKMKRERKYFAIIIDEYGGMIGIVTVHDLIEAVFGDLDDEDTQKPVDIEFISENTWKIQGFADLDDVSKALEIELPTDTYDTFSGFICGLTDRIPAEGESFSCETDKLNIEVKNVINHMVDYAIVKYNNL